jgi:hypothetical protein
MKKKIYTCFRCNCKEGEFHRPGCPAEICPFCGGQLTTCSCCYEQLHLIDRSTYTAKTGFLPEAIYKHGLNQQQMIAWDAILKAKGLIPYIAYPQFCGRCGTPWPVFFRVPDEEWQH